MEQRDGGEDIAVVDDFDVVRRRTASANSLRALSGVNRQ